MTTSRGALAVMVSGIILCAAPPASEALTFSSSIQRFEADGNAYGSADGVFDLVDEFDDGMLAPNWAPLLGTALEAGGVMTLRDPGVSVPFTGLPQEISTVESTAEVANGLGDFVLTAYWDPAPLLVNRQLFLQLYGTSPVIEATGLTVSNLDAATAAGAGAPTGYSVQFSRVFPLGNQEPPVALFVPIVPAAITGPIALRLSFDDATDLLTGSFSLDGGVTFESPFPALQAFKRTADGELLVGAAAIPAGTPPPACAYAIAPAKVRFQRLAQAPGSQTFRMSGTAHVPPGVPPFFDPASEGVVLTAASGSGPIAAFAVPGGGGPPNAGCGPKDGWSLRGRTYTYRNESGLMPPGCTTSANGLHKVKLADNRTRNGTLKLSLVALRTSFPSDTSVPAGAAIGLGGQDVCANAPLACTGSANTIKCR